MNDRESSEAGFTGTIRIRRVGLFGAYFAGAFGLGVNAMGNFLVPLRAHELGAGFDLIGLIVGAGDAVPKAQLGLALGLRASVNQTAATGAPIVVGPLIAASGALMAFSVSGAVALVVTSSALTIHLRRRIIRTRA